MWIWFFSKCLIPAIPCQSRCVDDVNVFGDQLHVHENDVSYKRKKSSSSDMHLWHLHLGRIGVDKINRLFRDGLLRDM